MDDLLAGFGDQVEDLIDSLADLDAGVGDSIPVMFDPKVASKYGINEAGRMSRNGGVREFHAAPTSFNRISDVITHVDDHTSDVHDFVTGKHYEFNRKRLLPVSKYQYPDASVPNKYEPLLLKALESVHGHVTLVNPNLGTLWRCQSIEFSLLITDRDREYMMAINNILASDRWSGPREKEFVSDVKGIAYLGSNGPRNIPDQCIWAALTPNPYQVNFPYEQYSLVRRKDGVSMSYVKKDRTVSCFFGDEPEHFRYNPRQVDSAYRKVGDFEKHSKGTDLRFFLETTSRDLRLPAIDMKEGNPLGRLPDFPPYVDGVSQDEKYVYDVAPVTSTYTSRRKKAQRCAEMIGKKLVPYTLAGRNVVTIMSCLPFVGPFASEFCHNGSKYVTLQDEYSLSSSLLDTNHRGILYSRTLDKGVTITPFPEGSYVSVPFDPRRRLFEYVPTIPGLFFFFPNLPTMYAFQLSVLYRLYGSEFRPPRCPYVPLDYTVSDVSPYIHGVLNDLSPAPLFQGGLPLREVARLAKVSCPYMISVLDNYTRILVYEYNSITHMVLLSKITDTFVIEGGVISFQEVWDDWRMGRKIKLKLEHQYEFLSVCFSQLGRPVVRRVVTKDSFELWPPPVRDFSSRKVELGTNTFVDAGSFIPYGEGMI